MKQKDIAWKIIRYDATHDELFSSSTIIHRVKYGIGTITKPNLDGNPFLFVFKTRSQARKWIGKCLNYYNVYRIYKCRVTNLRKTGINKHGRIVNVFEYCDFPGAMFADTVELLKRA